MMGLSERTGKRAGGHLLVEQSSRLISSTSMCAEFASYRKYCIDPRGKMRGGCLAVRGSR
jgi:hypothetical protein